MVLVTELKLQFSAVESALKKAGKIIVSDHFENCIMSKVENEELKEEIREHTLLISPYYVKENFIPVQQVKEKIEELKINLVNMQGEELLIYESKIDVLEELLEGRKI